MKNLTRHSQDDFTRFLAALGMTVWHSERQPAYRRISHHACEASGTRASEASTQEVPDPFTSNTICATKNIAKILPLRLHHYRPSNPIMPTSTLGIKHHPNMIRHC